MSLRSFSPLKSQTPKISSPIQSPKIFDILSKTISHTVVFTQNETLFAEFSSKLNVSFAKKGESVISQLIFVFVTDSSSSSLFLGTSAKVCFVTRTLISRKKSP